MLARFKVQSVLKGRADQEITLQYREDRGGYCGCSFSVGQVTTVLAGRNRIAGEHASGCTFPTDDAKTPKGEDRYLNALNQYLAARTKFENLSK